MEMSESNFSTQPLHLQGKNAITHYQESACAQKPVWIFWEEKILLHWEANSSHPVCIACHYMDWAILAPRYACILWISTILPLDACKHFMIPKNKNVFRPFNKAGFKAKYKENETCGSRTHTTEVQ
jgi:hypothetical protein